MNMPKYRFVLLASLLALAFAPLSYAAKGDAKAQANKGVQLAQQGAFDEAIAAFTEAIKIDPSDARFYRDRGGVYLTTKRFPDAVNDFAKVVELSPKDYSGY